MSNVLIITDDLHIADNMTKSFMAAGWHSRQMDLMKFISHDNHAVTQHYQCALLHVDKYFADKYEHLIDDVSEVIKSCTVNMPIYLTFEDCYDHRFYWWRLRSKRIYEAFEDARAMQEIIQEITKLETTPQNRATYVSPMG